MGTAVKLNSVSVKYAKYAGPAGITTCIPDVVDGVACIIHADNGLVPVLAETPFYVRPDLTAAFQTLFSTTNRSGLGRETRDGIQHVICSGLGEELPAGVDPVVDANQAYPILPAEIQEDPELTDAAKGIAEFAHHNHIALTQAGEHPSPLETVLLLGAFLFNNGVASELLHPRKVFTFGGEVFREEKVSVFCHISGHSLPLI